MVEKVGFTNCVFEKLCFPDNTIFIVFSAKHSFSKTKLYVEKAENLWKIVGCFWTWQNGVFGFVFWGFNIKKFVFGVSGIVSKVLKNAGFSQFFGFFLGCLIVVHLGLEGLGVFVFLVFVFLSCFCFCFVCFVIGLVVGCCCFVFLVFFCCFFCFVFFLFCFFGGFKGQVRWPKGPPHLALNPPYFICFVFLFLFFLFFSLFFVCFFGGFKGQVRWPKGPPHLALNPPYFICFSFFFLSLSLLVL